MISQELLRQQRDLEPKDDLDRYVGQWVVLRGGHVVDHAGVVQDLLERHAVIDGDALLQVPSPSESILF
jgi:Family of unknown function (DUF5678)